ncbi:SDR family NAD(P)-dependent oxidoreductase [Aestuariimicrobium kwangyangense]|uniref:SDR family NAD(P)-dependent oxidoreductase n=1 Tax=Aestuariimicrobium kwangyangense TaxID=396389 RepID=UPI0003B745AE|nr:SDR family NAD(P)-dependent oxidoreductase [Aestuariimicrobium kwangyangense]
MATALVTGGTAGIGNAFCRHLAARGYDLVIVARDVDRMNTLATELHQAYGAEVEVLPADLSVAADVTRVAERVEDADRPVDLVVNNAGFGLHAKLLDKDELGLQRRAMDVMCWAVLELSTAAGRAMKARGRGTIINVASTSAWIMSGNYSAVKAWCLSFTQGLANELHGTGVKVSALCPGWVHTEFHDRAGINAGTLPDIVWVDVDTLVQSALDDAEAGKVISVPTLKWKAAIQIAQHAPRWSMRLVSRALSSSRQKKK